jgi:hypothetical protein
VNMHGAPSRAFVDALSPAVVEFEVDRISLITVIQKRHTRRMLRLRRFSLSGVTDYPRGNRSRP